MAEQAKSYVGSYRRPGAGRVNFDPASTILETIESAEESVGGRVKTVRDFENAAAERKQAMIESLAETKGMDDLNALDSLQQSLMDQVDELYKLDISTFEGDRSAYLKKKNQTERAVGDVAAFMGLIDQEAEMLKEMEGGGQFGKRFLQSNNKDYYDFVLDASKGGKNISFRIQDGDIIAQLNGKDLFNGHAYINAKKDGYDLVEYAGDYSKEINEADTKAYQGLEDLVTTTIQEKINNRNELTKEEKTDYSLAKQKYRERLESGIIPLPINESTYQMFTNYATDVDADGIKMDKWGKDIEIQSAATREAIIDSMVKNRFPNDVVTDKIEMSVEQPMDEYQREQLKLQRRRLALQEQAAQEKEKPEKVLPFVESRISIENFTSKEGKDKSDQTRFLDVYNNGMRKIQERLNKDKQLTPAQKENLLLQSEANLINKLNSTDMAKNITKSFDDYLNKNIDIGGKSYKIVDFVLGVDAGGNTTIRPTYLDENEKVQSVEYKLTDAGLEALNDDLLQAGEEQFREQDPNLGFPDYSTNLNAAQQLPVGTNIRFNGKNYTVVSGGFKEYKL